MVSLRSRSRLPVFMIVVAAIVVLTEPVTAHTGSLRLTDDPVSVPSWLVITTGGGVIGASFLLTSLITDHETIQEINELRFRWSGFSGQSARVVVIRSIGLLSVAFLGLIVLNGLVGSPERKANLAILVVWVAWWGGYTMSVYLVGNSWPILNPWRKLASILPQANRSFPVRLGVWPSVVGLLGLVWIEVVSPVAQTPALLASLIVLYSVVTLAGAMVYGTETWFGAVDPIARVFRFYGRIAPVQRSASGSGIEIRLPSTQLTRERGEQSSVVFVIALLWATTYDGLVGTPAWAQLARWAVGFGFPPLVLYAVAMAAGFGLFLVAYRRAALLCRRTGRTYVAAHDIQERFILSLLPIAAGYHLAHYLGYVLAQIPSVIGVLSHPLSPPATPQVWVLPNWFGSLPLVFILLGHVFAVWVAHARAFDLFPGRLQPIRSQYPLIAVMILYTMTSMWLILQPNTQPPFV